MVFDKEKFTADINKKMHKVMFEQQKKLGLRYFASDIGISLATFHRVTSFKDFDLNTLLLILEWLGTDFNDYIKK
jgi:predicted transcriptional regulator